MRRILSQGECSRLRRLCRTMSIPQAAIIVGCRAETVRQVKKRGWKAGTGKRSLRARPADFARVGPTMSRVDLAKHYRAAPKVIARWAAEIDLPKWKPLKTCPALPVPDGSEAAMRQWGKLGTPDGLDECVRTNGADHAAEIYGVHHATLRRWRRKLGLVIGWSRQPGARRDPAAPFPKPVTRATIRQRAEVQAARRAIATITHRQHTRARREREQAY